MNGCALWENQVPEKQVKKILDRDCTAEELQIFDKLLQKFLENTKIEREIIKTQYGKSKRNPYESNREIRKI
jgi:hypothetical protein